MITLNKDTIIKTIATKTTKNNILDFLDKQDYELAYNYIMRYLNTKNRTKKSIPLFNILEEYKRNLQWVD